MGRSPCCDKGLGLKKGPWTPEEDQKLLAYIEEHGHGSWRSLPSKAGLQRCGKSCRLRWTNYLRPDIKRGKFNLQEEQTIIQLHALLGNRWSAIATHLPKRTDNEIKNYWNTHLKKRLAKMGIDPVTHKPKNESLFSVDGPSKNAANLCHMAQWESARLEAEARLVRQSKLRSNSLNQLPPPEASSASTPPNKPAPQPPPRCIDVLKAWNGLWPARPADGGGDTESPTSTVSFSENPPRVPTSTAMIEFVGNSGSCGGGAKEDWRCFGDPTRLSEYKEGADNTASFSSGLHDEMTVMPLESGWAQESASGVFGEHVSGVGFIETFTDLLLSKSGDRSFSEEGAGESDDGGDTGGDYYNKDNKNYWNSILDLVNSSPSESPMF